MRRKFYLVTLRHRASGEYKTSLVPMTADDAAFMRNEIFLHGTLEPGAPNGNLIDELPGAFAVASDVVNVERLVQH